MRYTMDIKINDHFKTPNITAFCIGLYFGVAEGLSLPESTDWPFRSFSELSPFIIFLLVMPSISAILNNTIFRESFKVMDRINAVVGFYSLIISFFLVTTIVGFTKSVFTLEPLSPGAPEVLLFFGAIGSIGAYFLDVRHGYKYIKNL